MKQDTPLFEQRKIDHVRLALDPKNQSDYTTQLEQINLLHDSLPDINLKEVSILASHPLFGVSTPFYIAGMTAGHDQAQEINKRLASLACERKWLFGVGSQRREFESLLSGTSYLDPSVSNLGSRYPGLNIIANLGITQLIEAYHLGRLDVVEDLADQIGAKVICIHLNPLQEALQQEGTPNFKNSLEALLALTHQTRVPVMIKETGSGMSSITLNKLATLNLFAIDVSGLGGTHWGRIEGKRAESNSISHQLGETFQNWGTSTAQSLLNAKSIIKNPTTEIWASGGVRSGLDAAKLLAMGATRVGFAMPALKAALDGEGALDLWMEKIEQELKVAMFCTNSKNLSELNVSKVSHE